MKAPHRLRPCRHAGVCSPARQRGFNLIELMIAVTLGLFIIGGTIGIYLANVQAFRTNEGLSRIQENLRTSFEVMAKELRQAGGTMCGSTQIANVLNGSASQWSSNWAGGTLVGYDGAAAPAVAFGSEAGQRLAGTDAISMLSGDLGNSSFIVSHDTAAAEFELPTGHAFKGGKLVVVCDGHSATLLQLTGVDGTQASYRAAATDDEAAPTVAPGNCSTALGYPTNCDAGTTKAFDTNAVLAELTAATWYVGNNSRGGKSLFRAGATASEEIAEGVSDLQIQYLLQDVASRELDSNWVDASAITDWTTAAAKQVVAVQVTLTLVSSGNIGTNNNPIQRQLTFVANLRSRTP